jgi:hypothetical protein
MSCREYVNSDSRRLLVETAEGNCEAPACNWAESAAHEILRNIPLSEQLPSRREVMEFSSVIIKHYSAHQFSAAVRTIQEYERQQADLRRLLHVASSVHSWIQSNTQLDSSRKELLHDLRELIARVESRL